jgi:CBS domain-containing protein
MTRERIGLLVIASPAAPRRALAVVSERDLVRAVASGSPLDGRVESVATKRPVSARRSDAPSKAVRLMVEKGIRHLIVENDDGTLFGVLSIRDFFRENRLLRGLLKEEVEGVHGTD